MVLDINNFSKDKFIDNVIRESIVCYFSQIITELESSLRELQKFKRNN